MKKTIRTIMIAGLASGALVGCIHVSDTEHDVIEVEQNALTAEKTCGGKERVESVTEDGFTCKN